MSSETTVTLVSSDNNTVEVNRDVAVLSGTIAKMLNNIQDVENQPVHLYNVKGSILSKVLEYCRFHAWAEAKGRNGRQRKTKNQIKIFDTEYMRVDQSTLYDLILAADYLDICPLLDLCCRTVATILRSIPPEQIRLTFDIKGRGNLP